MLGFPLLVTAFLIYVLRFGHTSFPFHSSHFYIRYLILCTVEVFQRIYILGPAPFSIPALAAIYKDTTLPCASLYTSFVRISGAGDCRMGNVDREVHVTRMYTSYYLYWKCHVRPKVVRHTNLPVSFEPRSYGSPMCYTHVCISNNPYHTFLIIAQGCNLNTK